MLSSEMESTLGGRYITKEVMTFPFDEYLSFNNVSTDDYSSQNMAVMNNLSNNHFVDGRVRWTI